jgi:hypothetical protein
MAESCFNCKSLVNENYCGSCGQKKYSRIDKKYILSELENTISQTNKGFLYSIKNIIINPGKTAREFIDGSRVNHYKPVLLAFLLSGISAFISFNIIGLIEIMKAYYSKMHLSSQLMSDYMSFTTSYNSLIMLFTVPFLAIITKIAFRKWGQNYYEHIVMNAYILSLYTIIIIVIFYPILCVLKNNQEVIIYFSSLSFLIIPIIMIWFFKGYYREKSLTSIIGRVLLIILILFFSFIILIIASVIGGFVFAMIRGPKAMNALEYLKPK